MSDVVQVQDEGHVRLIRMNRPEKKNAVSLELAWGVITEVRESMLDDELWVLGLTGSEDAIQRLSERKYQHENYKRDVS